MAHFGAYHFGANHFAATHFQFEYDQDYVSAGWDVCARCWTAYPERQLKREWTGLLVCKHCFDHRHPQDFVRGVPDRQGVRPGLRPEPTDVFIYASLIREDGSTFIRETTPYAIIRE